jgi:hypothetical protein
MKRSSSEIDHSPLSIQSNNSSEVDDFKPGDGSIQTKKYKYRVGRNPNVKWSPEEDKNLVEIVQHHGPKNWKNIAKILDTGRTGK